MEFVVLLLVECIQGTPGYTLKRPLCIGPPVEDLTPISKRSELIYDGLNRGFTHIVTCKDSDPLPSVT